MTRWLPLLALLSGCTVMNKSLWRIEVKGDLFGGYETEPFFGRGIDDDYDDSDYDTSSVEVPDWSVSEDIRWKLMFTLEDHRTLLDLYDGSSSRWEGQGGPLGITHMESDDDDAYAYRSVSYYDYTVEKAKDRKMIFDVDVYFDDESHLEATLKMKGFAEGKDDPESTEPTDPYAAR